MIRCAPLICALCCGARAAQVDYRVFPNLAHMDGNWSALYAVGDGKAYVGLAYQGSDGHLAWYDAQSQLVGSRTGAAAG